MTEVVKEESASPASVNDWVDHLGRWAKDKGWGSNRRSVLERLALVHSEVSEAVEALRDGSDPKSVTWLDGGVPSGVPIELADVVMRVMVLCAEEGIDLELAMRVKLDYNRSRPYRHGRAAF